MVAGEGLTRTRSVALALGVVLAPLTAWGPDGWYSLDDYQLRTSSDLLDICTLDPSHSHYWEGRSFLHRLLRQRDRPADALAVSKDFPRLACPGGKVTRNEVVETFVTYGKAHLEHLDERPMDTVFRAVIDRWPCES